MRVILKKGSKTPVPHHLSAAAAALQNPTTAPSAGPSGSDSSSSAEAASAPSSSNSNGNGGGSIGSSLSSPEVVAKNKKRGRSLDDELQESVPQQQQQKQQSEQKKPAAAAAASSSGRKRRHLDTTAATAAAAGTNNQSQHVRFEDQPNYLSPTAAAASIKQALASCKPSSGGVTSTSASASASLGSASTSGSASGGTNSGRRSKTKNQAGILRPPTRIPAAASATATATAKSAAACLPEQPHVSAGTNSTITISNMGIPARQLENGGQQEEEEAGYMRSVRGRGSSSRSPNPEDDPRRDQDPADADDDDYAAAFAAPGEDDPANDSNSGVEDPATDAREENEVNVLSVIPRSFNSQSRGASPSPSSSSSSSSSSSRRSGRSRSNSPEVSSARSGRRSNTTSAPNGNGAGGRKKRSSPLTAGILSQYQDALKKRGLEMVEQEGDGNCLFRAVSLQVYGDPNNHAEVRKRCMDFMAQNEEHFAQFIPDEPFRVYVARKRILGVHGNNPEIQAFSELFNRPIEIYEPQNGGNPINIFQGEYKTSDDPIRLSYHDSNHYNAIVDPYKPTAGLGLGLPGLQPGLADEMQLDKAKQLSDKAEVDRALKESRLAHDRMYEKKAFAISELEAADFDLEQAVIQSSLQSYLNEEGRKRSPHHHHHRHLHHHRDRARRQGSTPSPTGHSSYSGGPSHRHRHHGYGPGSSPTSPSAAASRDDDGYGVSFSSVGASSSASAGFASAATARRSSSPSHSASAASVGPASGPVPAAGTAIGGDEYPQCVQELVMNGFELPKVLRAYELVGDNFDSLLSFLMSG